MVVSLGAALFVMIPLQVDRDSNLGSGDAYNAVARITQGVVTGLGFLGGGVIIRQSRQEPGKAEVKGLTTAASIWLAGALGSAAGCGLWQMSLIGTLMTLVVLSGVKKLKKSGLIPVDDRKKTKTLESETESRENVRH